MHSSHVYDTGLCETFIFVKNGLKCSKVQLSEIVYIESLKKYSRVITLKAKYLILNPLGNIERLLPDRLFCRVHRSYIISLLHTSEFEHDVVQVGDKQLPIGRHYRQDLLKKVIILSNEKAAETLPTIHMITAL